MHCRASQSFRPDLQNQPFHYETEDTVNGYIQLLMFECEIIPRLGILA